MSEFTDYIRNLFTENDNVRDKGLKTPESIFRYDNIVYGSDENIQLLDVYSRKESLKQIEPVIVSVHGGGWIYGDKERYQYYGMDLAKRGFKVINFTYHLAPEFKYPTSIIDLNLVMQWLKKNKDKYYFDINNIFAVGDSAGATLLGVYAGILAKPSLGKTLKIVPPSNIHLKSIALNHGCYDLTTPTGIGEMATLNDGIMKELFADHGTAEELKSISVPNYISENYPSVFMISSSDDFLRNEPQIMIKALTDNNIPFIYHFFGSNTKKLPHVFHLDIRNEDAKLVNDEECNYFKALVS